MPCRSTSNRHIFIDNASHDGTVAVLRAMAAESPEVQVIVNTRNFGAQRSSNYPSSCPPNAFLGTIPQMKQPKR
jgi:hypothetical protein